MQKKKPFGLGRVSGLCLILTMTDNVFGPGRVSGLVASFQHKPFGLGRVSGL